MQFIGFFEYSAENVGNYFEKFRQMTAEREKGTENSPKLIFGPFLLEGENRGFAVYETDDPDRLMRLSLFFTPELKVEFVPIIETRKAAELYRKMKK